MDYVIISLKSLYETINKIHGYQKLPPQLPRRGTSMYQQYFSESLRLISNIKGKRAVYLWFYKGLDEFYEPIYVGETYRSERGLKGRFSDEFKQWYHIFWMTKYNTDKYEPEVIKMYNTPNVDYTDIVKNQSLKKGASHIIYVTNITDDVSTKIIQDDLIQLFNNPRGNAKDKRKVPLPDEKLHHVSKEIYKELLNRIKKVKSYSI